MKPGARYADGGIPGLLPVALACMPVSGYTRANLGKNNANRPRRHLRGGRCMMSNLGLVLLVVVGWIVLQRFILPRLGVST